jgi:colicin import membrane protein
MIHQTPEAPGKKYALTFTILVHVGLVAALFLGVQWKRSPPEVMEVELWSSRPQPATQIPPPPPPEPEVRPEPKPEPKPVPKVEPKPEVAKKPDIAIKEEKKKSEPKKPEPRPEPPKPEPEPKKPEPKPVAKPQPPVDPFKEMLEREEKQRTAANNQARLAAAAESEQRASASKRGLADYATKIRGKVRGNIALPPNIQGNPEAIFEVNQLPSGEVLSIKLKRSSGNAALDTAIERAILKSSPLPKPDDPSHFQRTLEIKYKPFEE